MTTKVSGDKAQALLCNQMSAGFADLAAVILRFFLSPRAWLEPWWSGTVAKNFGWDWTKSDIKTDCKLILLARETVPLGRSQCPVCYLCLQGFWTVNIPIELKDLMDEAEMFASLQQL